MTKLVLSDALRAPSVSYEHLVQRIIKERNTTLLEPWKEIVRTLRGLRLGALEIRCVLDACEFHSCNPRIIAEEKNCIIELLQRPCGGENYTLIVAAMMAEWMTTKPSLPS